jgi:hypothetical protein
MIMDCTYCNDSGMTHPSILSGIPWPWMICGCAAGVKIASRLALRPRPGIGIPDGGVFTSFKAGGLFGSAADPAAPLAAKVVARWIKLREIVEAQKMKEWALGDRPGTIHSIRGWAFGNVLAWMRAIEAGEDPTPKDPKKIVAEIQAEAKRSGTDKLTDAEINAEIASSREERKKTPADRLADAALDLISSLTSKGYHPGVGRIGALDEAITEYRSTSNAHPTFNAIVGNPPDPIMLARLTVDSLTGGALSSLICYVIDDLLPAMITVRESRANDGRAAAQATIENVRVNLRALGEKP